MNEPLAVLKHRLLEAHNLQQQTRSVEQNILKASRHRLEIVEKEINKLRTRALTDYSAGDRYMEFTQEKGRLLNVIANSEARL